MSRDLTPAQGDVMDFLGRIEFREQGTTVLAITGHLGGTPESTVRTLTGLVRLGLVQRRRQRGGNIYELSGQGLAVQGHRESTRRWNAMRSGS